MNTTAHNALYFWITLYAGAVLGFSFIATPAKFLATDVHINDLLLVGRATFGVFAWVEAAACVVLFCLAWRASSARFVCVALISIVTIQHFLLRPILDERVSAIVSAEPAPPSLLHHVYGVLELCKVVLLLATGWTLGSGSRLSRTESVPVPRL